MKSNEYLNGVLINAKNCSTKKTLIDEFAQKLNFTDHYAHNWDSFEEIINRTTINQHIFIYNTKYLLQDDIESRVIFKDILHDYNQTNAFKFFNLKTY